MTFGNNPAIRQAADSYYQASRRYHLTAEQLRGASSADVVIIGGGITGASAALYLAQHGVDVALLEGRQFGWGASGRSGGQILAGYSADQIALEKLLGADHARELWQHSVAALEWTRRRIAEHRIDCDLQAGYLHVAVRPAQGRALQRWADHMQRHYGYGGLDYLAAAQVQNAIASARYCGAVSDPNGGHLHPLNYCLGLTSAAQRAGARLYENSAALQVESAAAHTAAPAVTIRTAHGVITAAQVVYACNAYLERLAPTLARMIMPVGTYIIATEPLDAATAKRLIAHGAAVADTNLALDYFRLSADNRMLFGGRVSYSTRPPRHMARSLRRRMLAVFPQLAAARIDFAWGGYVAITRNRAPHIGQLGQSAWFAQGFSGHGMALAGYAGSLLGAALGDGRAVECFQKIPHRAFPGGYAWRTPALVAAMGWQRLRDRFA